REDIAVGLDRAAERSVQQAAKVVSQMAGGDEPVYGVNTGFGDLSTVRIPHDELRALQRNLVRSHAVGVGPALAEDVVRAILLLRANTLAAGRSGVRADVIDLLCDMLNRRVHPHIPMHGSVGAMSAEALRGTDRAWDEELHASRPHPGQQTVAGNLRALMAGSPNVASHRVGDPRVQDPYSVRCMPQVHGATRDALGYTRRV